MFGKRPTAADYAAFKAAVPEDEVELSDRMFALSEEIDRAIAEGMLHTVIGLPQPEAASSQLEQFATELRSLRPDPAAETESDPEAADYQEFCYEFAVVQRGLPAVVEIFKAYAEGRCDLRKEPLDLLEEAQRKLPAEPREALILFGEAGCLCLRGLEGVDDIALPEGMRPQVALADWLEALVGVVGCCRAR